MSSLLSLSSVNNLEEKIKKELRFYNTYLLAGNREHERNAWNLLIDVTNNFSNRQENQIEKGEASSSSSTSDWIAERNLLADLTWNQYTGDVILTLLALVGGDADLWMSQKVDNEDTPQEISTFTHPLTQTESRLHRYLLPHEKMNCRNLYFEIIFQNNNNSIKTAVANTFDILLPLLLSFSSPTTAGAKSEKSSDSLSLTPPATSGILRSIVAASITGLLSDNNNNNKTNSPSPLFSILFSTVCEKSELPPSIMMESGFRIAEVLAAPPVTHGSILQLTNTSDTHKKSAYHWKPKLTASEIVQYYSSILHQIGDDVLIRVNPQVALSSSTPSSKQQHGISSTNMRMLCATLFLIGRIAAPATKSNPSQPSSKIVPNDEYDKLRTMLSSTFLLPRLVLIDRELLGPCFGSLTKRTRNDISEKIDITLSLKKLESLLAALEAAPTMVLSNTVEKSVIGVVVLIWEKIGNSAVDIAFSPSDDTAICENKLIARRCIKYILSSIAERILRSNSSTTSSQNSSNNNFEENMFLHNILFQPFLDIILTNFSHVNNDNVANDDVDPVDEANQTLEDFIDLVFKTAASIVVVAVPNSASTTIATTMSSSSTSSHVDIVATLILTEFFRACVHSQESRGKDSSSDRAHTLFISLLLSKISPKQMMLAASQVYGKAGEKNSILFLDQLLRFCKWSLRALVVDDDKKSESQISGLALITLDLIANLQEDDYIVVPGNDKNDFTFAFLLVLKTIDDLQIEINKISSTIAHEKQESALRNLEILKKRFSLEMVECREPGTSDENDDHNNSSLIFDNLVRDFVRLFQEMRNLHERKMFSILTVTLMELCDKVRQIPQVFKKILVNNNNNNNSNQEENIKNQMTNSREELWTRLVNQEIFEKEIDYLVKNVLLKSSVASVSAVTDAAVDQNANDSSNSSSKSASTRRPLKRFNAVAASAMRTKGKDQDGSKSEESVSPSPIVGATKDDQVVSAACSLLSLICLFRLDNKNNNKEAETKTSPSSVFYNLLSQCLGEALQTGTKIVDDKIVSPNKENNNTLSILSGFAATMLDVVVRVADDDSEGLTLRRIFFGGHDSGKVLSSPEALCLEIVRATDSENIHYQAVRLCCLNVLAKCYQLVPLKCNFDLIESVIVGIFRAQSSSSSSSSSSTQNNHEGETHQILRLAAAALLSGIIPAAVVSILTSNSDTEIIVATFKKIKTFSGHVAQYRNPGTSLFDAEIREHGRIAEKHLRAALPEELVGIVFFEEAVEM